MRAIHLRLSDTQKVLHRLDTIEPTNQIEFFIMYLPLPSIFVGGPDEGTKKIDAIRISLARPGAVLLME